MHDTLQFFERDPLYRHYHMRDITFGLVYGFSEQFILSLSHDEVVHGKGSMIEKMPGDEWQRFANLRLCLAMMYVHPGKKLMFMGIEFGQEKEWNVDVAFPWPHPYDRYRSGLMRMVCDLNALYRDNPALHQRDGSHEGFNWIIESDSDNTVFAFRRLSTTAGEDIVIIANATPVPRHHYRLGVPEAGHWREAFNSDSEHYAGSNLGNDGGVDSMAIAAHGYPQSIELLLPPLGLLAFRKHI